MLRVARFALAGCAKVHTSLSAGGSRDAVCSTFQWKWPGGATPLCPGSKPNSNALKSSCSRLSKRGSSGPMRPCEPLRTLAKSVEFLAAAVGCLKQLRVLPCHMSVLEQVSPSSMNCTAVYLNISHTVCAPG